ncbi:uncharacterized protein A4U43_C10F3590 [Asparagus officinalis]|uniref:Peptidase S8/S53 domain-containing protein n=1 Tax=Asparagus officinalis TaxID=4686 RepID=A0A5P1E3G6_ASPOF|nr:uncharacterized protein A4U43_C10F3590 [Asparagus officinalis]
MPSRNKLRNRPHVARKPMSPSLINYPDRIHRDTNLFQIRTARFGYNQEIGGLNATESDSTEANNATGAEAEETRRSSAQSASTVDELFRPKIPTGTGRPTRQARSATGNPVDDANVVGYAKGAASGLAPGAHLAVYKVSDGTSKDILKGIDQAIRDNMDILSMSVGFEKPLELYKDDIAIGSFAAVTKGIVTVRSGQGD